MDCQSIFYWYVESAFRRTVITVRLKPDTTYNWKVLMIPEHPIIPCGAAFRDASLMTPEQCLAHAAAWRTAGNEYLAKQFQNLWQARMVRRMKEAPERVPESPSPSIAPQA